MHAGGLSTVDRSERCKPLFSLKGHVMIASCLSKKLMTPANYQKMQSEVVLVQKSLTTQHNQNDVYLGTTNLNTASLAQSKSMAEMVRSTLEHTILIGKVFFNNVRRNGTNT